MKIPQLLIVDDEPDTCDNLSDIFTDLGYAVDVAHQGQSALELVNEKHYDVALLDFSAGQGLLDRADDNVAQGGLAARERPASRRTAQHLNAPHHSGAGVVCHVKPCLLFNH